MGTSAELRGYLDFPWAAQGMATLRNLALSLLRRAGAGYTAPALRHCARSDPQTLRLIGLRL